MRIHVVQRGETLWQISRNYSVAMNQVALANEIPDLNVLAVGQALVVPEQGREYIVQPGDYLWTIAQRFNTTVQAIAETNQIYDTSMLFPGQMLIISPIRHTVQPGEALWSIAQRYGVTVESIVQTNQIANPALIYPGQVLHIPVGERPPIEVNAYATEMDEAGALEVLRLGMHFTYLTPFMYSIRENGSITELNDASVLRAARRNHVAPLLVLTNFINGEFNSDLAASILRDPELQKTLLTNILTKIKAKGYLGLNIDFEYVYPEDRENYNAFLRRTVARLRPEGLSVSTALAPKIRGDQQGLLYEAHDYAAHGEIADFVILMTYEWGWAGGRPWAIAPVNEVRKVLDYAVTVIPRNKIMMGMPLYGRDWKIPWVQGTFAATISPQEAVRIAVRYGASIQYEETYQAPFFRYVDETGQEHEVWFEDARSVQTKMNTVKEYGLRGVSYWVLGNPFPQNWHVQQRNFLTKKLL